MIMLTQSKRLSYILLAVPLLLLIPFIMNQFNDGEGWSIFDFILMGVLLTGVGLAIEFVLRKVKTFQSRLLLVGAVFFVFLLIWAELAVGIFGSPFAGN